MHSTFFYLLLLFFYTGTAFAQDGETCDVPDKKTEKYYNQALQDYNSRNYKSFEININKAIEAQEDFAPAYMLQAKYAKERNNIQLLVNAYEKLTEVCPMFTSAPYFYLGKFFFAQGDYEKAIRYMEGFLKFSGNEPGQAADMEAGLKLATFRRDAMNTPVPFDPQSVPGICTDEDEYLPIISPDNELAFFTRRFRKESKNRITEQLVEEFTFSKAENGLFSRGIKMPPPFNTSTNEGGATVTIDNKELYFTICRQEAQRINCDIYYSRSRNNSWGAIVNLGAGINDPVQWDSQPSISSDGNTLYFASGRDGGFGGLDIYKCEKDSAGQWGGPVNLGPAINSPGNEKSPFMHTDSRTLYFSSDSLMGMGGYDIFMAKQDDKEHWLTPKNIGYPINSESDDLGFFVSTDGLTGYFASNKLQGKGGWDIYSFFLYPEARPDKVLFVKGQLKDEITGQPLSSGRVEFRDAKTQRVYRASVDSATGNYVTALNFDRDYVMTAKAKGYASVSRYVSRNDSAFNKPATSDFSIKALQVGNSYLLNDIHFEVNSYTLTDTSRMLLDEFAAFLDENHTVKISINGHTDNQNDEQSNKLLSENRAKEVYSYLVAKGINPSRLSYSGYGESRPVAPNETPEGRARNRRTEFVILDR